MTSYDRSNDPEGLVRYAQSLEQRNDTLRAALTEITGWRNDTLGTRPKERTEYDCPQAETDAFDRGCRMAFYRCAERAQSALKE